MTLKTLMRRARIETTMNHYTDPALLDGAGAVELLPAMSAASARSVTTGTSPVALSVAPAQYPNGRTKGFPDVLDGGAYESKRPASPLRNAGNTGLLAVGDTGLEQVGDSTRYREDPEAVGAQTGALPKAPVELARILAGLAPEQVQAIVALAQAMAGPQAE